MLGSHFDLKSEIARIAAKRAAETKPPEMQAYSHFDDKLRDFIRSLSEDDWSADLPGTKRPTDGEARKPL